MDLREGVEPVVVQREAAQGVQRRHLFEGAKARVAGNAPVGATGTLWRTDSGTYLGRNAAQPVQTQIDVLDDAIGEAGNPLLRRRQLTP